ncbi:MULTISPECIES: hypothetical protein [unclassified Methylosinus]|jgi:hypothetical protein|uniref:hypothetical protein n=1 Tax=unclassified Methylosinus TaxID=2624500 RepID=UPI0010651976|nr:MULTISPECIES: hypothetical protein [unclassified Methylosinus]
MYELPMGFDADRRFKPLKFALRGGQSRVLVQAKFRTVGKERTSDFLNARRTARAEYCEQFERGVETGHETPA